MTYDESTKEYLRLRMEIWSIAGNVCVNCGKPAQELHHVVPRHMGGANRFPNVVPLCIDCHCKAHSKNRGSYKGGQGRPKLQKPSNFHIWARAYINGTITLDMALRITGLKRHKFYDFLHQFAKEEGLEHRLKNRRYIQGGSK